jgi:hypothetical protein
MSTILIIRAGAKAEINVFENKYYDNSSLSAGENIDQDFSWDKLYEGCGEDKGGSEGDG